jgi:pimeloyl-ACP methyl ester carboxylesterase
MKALFLLAAVASLATAAAPPGIPDGWTDGYVFANGIRIHYYHAVPAPGKPILVMAHGITDNGLSWATTTWELQSAYDIYMVDARGHGLSDPQTASDMGGAAVADLFGYLRAMNFEKAILMGHSMGAATVMQLAAQYPEVPRAVILLDPGLGVSNGGRGAAAAPASAPSRFPSLLMFGTPDALVVQNNRGFDDLVAQCRQDSPKWDPVDCQYWALSKKQYHGSYAAGAGRGNGGGMSIPETLSKIGAPVLILKADAPPETRKANEEVAKALKNGKLIHVDDAGHNLHHDRRKQSVDLIAAFLKDR